MLKVSNLSSGYGKSQVLNGLNFEVNAGEIVTLIGANHHAQNAVRGDRRHAGQGGIRRPGSD